MAVRIGWGDPPTVQTKMMGLCIICSQLQILPFNSAAADKYGTIRVYLESQGIPISERDLQIASIAMAANLTVVTHNVKEFGRISGLVVEDWAV